jgi:hypothetical protein
MGENSSYVEHPDVRHEPSDVNVRAIILIGVGIIVLAAILHSYGWVDEQAGLVRIPITRAMELLTERGLPVRPPQESQGNGPPEPGSQR